MPRPYKIPDEKVTHDKADAAEAVLVLGDTAVLSYARPFVEPATYVRVPFDGHD